MKTKTASLFLISVITTILITWAPTAAYAGVSNGAVVTHDGFCEVDHEGFKGSTNDALLVENNHKWVGLCKISFSNPPSEAQTFIGFDCSTLYGKTNNSQLIVQPTGQGLLHCIYDLSDKQ